MNAYDINNMFIELADETGADRNNLTIFYNFNPVNYTDIGRNIIVILRAFKEQIKTGL